jgi:hypothetical protein
MVSIRGLYVRRGIFTVQVNRIRWTLSSIKMEGVTIDIYPQQADVSTGKSLPRILELLPAVPYFTGSLLSAILFSAYAKLLRPSIRWAVIRVLQLSVARLSGVTAALTVEVYPISINYNGTSRVEFTIHKTNLGASLTFTNTDNPIDGESEPQSLEASSDVSRKASWKTLVSDGIRRSWSRALEGLRGEVKLSLSFEDMCGKSYGKDSDSVLLLFLSMICAKRYR